MKPSNLLNAPGDMHVTVYDGAIPDNTKTEALHGAREERLQSVAWQQARLRSIPSKQPPKA